MSRTNNAEDLGELPKPAVERVLDVAFYHSTLPRQAGRKGGVEAAVHRLANNLAERRLVNVTVYSSGEPPADALYAHRRILDASNRRRLTQLLFSPILLNRVDFAGADVVHLHGDDWFFFRRLRASVRTMYGSSLHEARTATRFRRKVMMGLCFLLEKISIKLATVNVAIGRETMDLYGTDALIGCSVDQRIYSPGEKSEAPTVIFIGGWDERKRGSFMYRTFVERILPEFPAAKLLMVTDHCPNHPSVTWLRNLTDQQLAEQLASAWVFAYPSIYEGFGIAYIEAMACGTAIVTTANAGAQEVLADGRYGEIVADDDFGATVVAVLRDDGRRRKFERDGFDRARDFDAEAISSQYERVYEDAVRRFEGGKQ